MDLDKTLAELTGLVALASEYSQTSQSEFERFQIALAGALKLLSTAAPTLRGLKGSPEEVQGYLLKEATDLRHSVLSRFEEIVLRLDGILPVLRGMSDRNS
jgi:hypothetical protein